MRDLLPDEWASPAARRVTEWVDGGRRYATETYGDKDGRRRQPPRDYLNSPLS
jgi:hypothetical protein